VSEYRKSSSEEITKQSVGVNKTRFREVASSSSSTCWPKYLTSKNDGGEKGRDSSSIITQDGRKNNGGQNELSSLEKKIQKEEDRWQEDQE